MHQKTVFILIANQEDLAQKLEWANSLDKSYQNSMIIITLISSKPTKIFVSNDDSIRLIHHPSNRPIEPHLLIIQQVKLCQSDYLHYILKPIDGELTIKSDLENDLCLPLASGDSIVGFRINTKVLSAQLKTDIQTSNYLRKDLYAMNL